MKYFTSLILVFALSILFANNSFAQTIKNYKINFQERPSDDAKLFLQKIADKAIVTFNTKDNSVVISTTSSLNENTLKGKFSKLNSPVNSIELLKNETIESISLTVLDKEKQDKAAKKQEQELQQDKNSRSVSSSPNKRH